MRAAPSSAFNPSRGSTIVRARPRVRVGIFFILVAVLSFLYISQATLESLGWRYSGGGSEIEKIHPGTYLLFVTLLVMRFADASFFRSVIAKFTHDIGLASFTVTSIAAALYAVFIKNVSISPFVDTLATTVVVFAIFATLEERPLIAFRRAVDFFMIVNIGIIAAEYGLHRILAPHYKGPEIISEYYARAFDRPAGFFGHPLVAADFICLYAIANIIVQMRSPSGKLWRILIAAVALMAAVLTGGRTSLFAALAIIALTVFFFAIKALIGGVLKRAEARTVFLLFAIFIIAVPIAFQLGAFDLLADRLTNDNGSALARSYAMDIVTNMSTRDLWLGIPGDVVLGQQQAYGLIAIEISWINFILLCGIIFTVPLFIGYFLFLFYSLRRRCVLAFVPALFLLVVQASSNAIWSKSTVFAAEVAILLSYTRRDLLEKSDPNMRRNDELPAVRSQFG